MGKSSGFQFKQFYVAHDRCAMKVGTDGVLLGAWTPLYSPCFSDSHPACEFRVLDIGTGSGLIALMLAQRIAASRFLSEKEGTFFSIDAIDIEPEAVQQAHDNFLRSPWSPHLNAILSSLQTWAQQKDNQYNLIVSNPPYFVNSLKNPDSQRMAARHTDSLSFEQLLSCSEKMLSEQGTMAYILPAENENEILYLAQQLHLFPTLLTRVYSKPSSLAPKRILLALKKQQHPTETIKCCYRDFYIESGTSPRSDEYALLTQDFYL